MRISEKCVSAAIVAGLLLVLAALAQAWAVRLERESAVRMAPQTSYQRDQGAALERATFSQPDILPLYGSSELEIDVPDRASDFFRDAPDGFQVCPIGRRGASPLLLLEKVAATRRAPACGKVVVLISPVWFLSRGATLSTYAGNFSALQGMELIYKAPLSPALRRDIARRMLDYPQTLAATPILDRGVRAAARNDTLAGRMSYALLLPLGLMETKVMEMQDHFESVREVLAAPRGPAPARARFQLNWPALMAASSAEAPALHDADPPGKRAEMLDTTWRGIGDMPTSTEWEDLELLLRTCRELRAQPLLLDIPWDAPYYDNSGVNAGIRAGYYERLHSLARKYDVPAATFQDHEYDMNFLYDRHSHLSAKGWIFFNRDIDAFWKGLDLPDR